MRRMTKSSTGDREEPSARLLPAVVRVAAVVSEHGGAHLPHILPMPG